MRAGKVISAIASNALLVILEGRIDIFTKVAHETQEARWLTKGDKLCRGMMTPMSRDLTEKIIHIYKKCKSTKGDTALMLSLDMGLMDMVWGFIECAKQTNTNLHTGQKGDVCVQEFFWLCNEQKQTAFDIAIEKGHVEVARVLLNCAPCWCLRSQWIRRREALLHLINHDPKFDCFIFDMLENVTFTSLHFNSPGVQLKIYNKGVERIVTREFLDNLNGLLGSDASKNSVLHLICKTGNVACVKYILEKYPSQIHSRNSDTETPAYVAAREGRVDILGFIINLFKKENEDIESVLTRSIDEHNALHIAIQNHRIEVIFLLIKEIPQLANANKSKESPLYLAAERGYIGVVKLMLKNCKKRAFNGPYGKTALHAAATSDSAGCVEYLLQTNPNLLNVKDDYGWTPLHHAIHQNSWLATTKLLNLDYSIGYLELIQENDTNISPIHLAASLGHCETMEVLIDQCPGCSDFIDNKGRNILHVAVEYKKNKVIEFIFRDKSLTNLINQKDTNGNTPIHLLIASDFEKMEMLMDSRVDINVRNKINLTPLDMLSSYDQRKRLIKAFTMVNHPVHDKKVASSKRKQLEAKENQRDDHFVIVDNLVVVASLTATASFAAAFTVPGGLESSDGFKKGTPFLLKEPAFQAFIITNAIAFSFSCCSLLCSIELLLYRNRYDELLLDEQEYVDGKVANMYLLTTLSLVAMTIAFIAGLYVVLTPAPSLAISVCVMTLLFRGIYHITTYEAARELAQPVKKITC